MPYVLDENENHIIDENGEKIMFEVTHIDTNEWYVHKESLLVDDNGHFHTENRSITIQEGTQPNHAVCKKQLDEINNNIYSKQDIDNKLLALENKITASINSLKSQINELRILIGYNKMNNHMPSNFNSNR